MPVVPGLGAFDLQGLSERLHPVHPGQARPLVRIDAVDDADAAAGDLVHEEAHGAPDERSRPSVLDRVADLPAELDELAERPSLETGQGIARAQPELDADIVAEEEPERLVRGLGSLRIDDALVTVVERQLSLHGPGELIRCRFGGHGVVEEPERRPVPAVFDRIRGALPVGLDQEGFDRNGRFSESEEVVAELGCVVVQVALE